MLRPVFGWRWHESPIFSSTPPGGIRLTSRASRHRGPSRSRQPASPPVRAKRVAAVAFCLASLLAPLGRAQFFDRLSNPTVTVDIRHPPSLGLQVDRLVFGPAAGECSDQIIAAMVDDFVSNGIEVVDRRNLDLILAEHDFAFSGYVDRASAARIGRILGPSAMLIVDVQRCAVEKKRFRDTVTRYDRETKTEYEQPVYSSRTRGFVKASIRTVDLATGRIFAARTLDYAPVRESESYEGYPEYPSEYDVLDAAFGRAVRDARRMFLPWTEKTELIFYDDKACGLKGAYQVLKAGMLEQALDHAEPRGVQGGPQGQEEDIGSRALQRRHVPPDAGPARRGVGAPSGGRQAAAGRRRGQSHRRHQKGQGAPGVHAGTRRGRGLGNRQEGCRGGTRGRGANEERSRTRTSSG